MTAVHRRIPSLWNGGQHRDPGDLLPALALKPQAAATSPCRKPQHTPPDLSVCTGGPIQFIASRCSAVHSYLILVGPGFNRLPPAFLSDTFLVFRALRCIKTLQILLKLSLKWNKTTSKVPSFNSWQQRRCFADLFCAQRARVGVLQPEDGWGCLRRRKPAISRSSNLC